MLTTLTGDTAAELNRYEAQAESDTTNWLGQLVTYTVNETSIRYEDLARSLVDKGLEEFLPKEPHDSDVFRRVCTGAEQKKVATPDPDVFVNVMVRNVGTKDGVVLKKIVCEEVNAKGQRLRYHEVYDVTFTQATGYVATRQLALGFPAADDVADEILRKYPKERGCVDGGAIRTLIRRVLLGHHAVGVRESGGLYFIIQSEATVVESLLRFAAEVGTKLYRIPLIDNGEQRAMIQEAAEEDTLADIDRALTQISTLLEQDTVKKASAATMVATFQSLQERAERYTDLLNTNLGGVAARLTVLDQAIAELMRKTAKPAATAAA